MKADRAGMVRWAAILSRFVLAGLFLLAGVLKIHDPGAFARALATFEMLPAGMVHPTAIVLPWVEVAAALALLIRPLGRDAGRLILAALLVAFTAAILAGLVRGLNIECGCFGPLSGLLGGSRWAVARNAALLALLAFEWRVR